MPVLALDRALQPGGGSPPGILTRSRDSGTEVLKAV